MKKQKVCALFCIAAISMSLATPAKADDRYPSLNETEETLYEKENQEEYELPDDIVVDSNNQSQEQQTTEEGTDSTEISDDEITTDRNNTSDGFNSIPEPGASEEAAELAIPDNGWYTDSYGNTFFYKQGKKLRNCIVELEDADGSVYGYYFDPQGVMARYFSYVVTNCLNINGYASNGTVKADKDGHLLEGWQYDSDTDTYTYYGKYYIQYRSSILEENGLLYYFNADGLLERGSEVVIDGILYDADENGVLTVRENPGKTGWIFVDEVWYYYQDGKLLTDTCATINGEEYYFGYSGQMLTGIIYDENLRNYRFAEASGKVVHATGWYYYTPSKKWYWFEKEGIVSISTFVTVNGKQFYLSKDGKMETGVFYVGSVENGHPVDRAFYADEYGAVSKVPGWKLSNGNWYYVKTNGEAAHSEVVHVNGKSYYLASDGIMGRGFIKDIWDGSESYTYIADASSGALLKSQWGKVGNDWYYAGWNWKMCKSQWIQGKYYVDAQGKMVIGAQQIDGTTYVFDEDGAKAAVIGEKNGWQLIDGDWYYATNGKPYNGWLNHTYYLQNGKMLADATVPGENATDSSSYVGADGAVQTGWILTLDGTWLYAEKNTQTEQAVLVKDCWKRIDGKWYYFDGISMVSDTVMEIDGKVSRFASGGAWMGYIAKTGWLNTASGKTYYILADGSLNTENMELDGNLYYFNTDGSLLKNAVFFKEDTSDGSVILRWINAQGNWDTGIGWRRTSKGDWVYCNGKDLATGNQVINGKSYRFDYNGIMVSDCCIKEENDNRYALYDKNGFRTYLSTGWYLNKESSGDVWYYCQNGRPYTGNVGAYYVQDGRMVTGMFAGYMYDNDGRLVTNRWVYLSNKWYYAGNAGKIYKGTCYVNGKAYLFDQNGAMIKAL